MRTGYQGLRQKLPSNFTFLPPIIVEPPSDDLMSIQSEPNSPMTSNSTSPNISPIPRRKNTIAMILNEPDQEEKPLPTHLQVNSARGASSFLSVSSPPSLMWNDTDSEEVSEEENDERSEVEMKLETTEEGDTRTGRKRSKGQAKRQRRTASEIRRLYLCQIPHCKKSYGSEAALKMHVKLKHQHTSQFYQHQFQHHIALARQKQIQHNYRSFSQSQPGTTGAGTPQDLSRSSSSIPSPVSSLSASLSASPSASPSTSPPTPTMFNLSGVDQRNLLNFHFNPPVNPISQQASPPVPLFHSSRLSNFSPTHPSLPTDNKTFKHNFFPMSSLLKKPSMNEK
eukprot:TRINITY_DN12250_c0_g1_i1.p1 TRINITY_DN12250_c0_g1~~TRINITY_DN12250_c0_g1_i1.p1  ORF type:complete len:377 (-),score=68.55 TRINITY_DN12250_c0_g1_i1:197-1213(-)